MAGPSPGGGGGGGFDFNAWQLSQQGSKGDGGGDSTNEKGIFDALFDTASKVATFVGKPFGVDMGQFGQTSIFTGLESQGITGKNIPAPLSGASAPGGILAKLLHAIFIKNREITDHTQYINTETYSGSGGGGEATASTGGDYGGGPMSLGGSEPMVMVAGAQMMNAGVTYGGDFPDGITLSRVATPGMAAEMNVGQAV